MWLPRSGSGRFCLPSPSARSAPATFRSTSLTAVSPSCRALLSCSEWWSERSILALIERRLGSERLEQGPLALLIAAISIALGALLFAGSLCRGGYVIWPGLIGGVICAGIGILATRPLLARVRARLDSESIGALSLIAEAAALLAAVLSVLLPPVGVIVVGLLLWLLVAGRGRGEAEVRGPADPALTGALRRA